MLLFLLLKRMKHTTSMIRIIEKKYSDLLFTQSCQSFYLRFNFEIFLTDLPLAFKRLRKIYEYYYVLMV